MAQLEYITDNTFCNSAPPQAIIDVEVQDRSGVVSTILCEPIEQPKKIKQVKNNVVNEDDKLVNGRLSKGIRATLGRNEPCPCGSGKKFKKCCGKFS